MAGIKHEGTVDIVWSTFWQQQECSVAVIMVSVSAFRSFFVAKKRPPKLPIASRRIIRANNQSPTRDESEAIDLTESESGKTFTDSSLPVRLPRIPSPTLGNVRGFVPDAQSSKSWMAHSGSENMELSSNGTRNDDHVPSSLDLDLRGTRREGLEKPAESQRPSFKHWPPSQIRSFRPADTDHPDADAEYAQPSGRKQSRWNRIARWRRSGSDGTQTGYWSILSMFRTGDARSTEQLEAYSETTKPNPSIPIPGGNP